MKNQRETFLISLVVPIYNVENYLEKCLDSIIKCNLEDVEVILVVDGSTDSSGEIAKKYAESNKFFSCYFKPNGGLANTRNYGIKKAKGKYICFLDSDDYLEKENFNKYLKTVQNNQNKDIFINDYYIINEREEIVFGSEQIKKSNKLMEKYLAQKGTIWNAWRTICKKSFLQSNNLYFKEGFLCEDVDFTTKVLTVIGENYMLSSCPYYCYRLDRKGSIMNNVTYKRVSDLVVILDENIRDLSNKTSIKEGLIIEKLVEEAILSTPNILDLEEKSKKDIYCKYDNLFKYIKKNQIYNGRYKKILLLNTKIMSIALYLVRSVRRIAKSGSKNKKLYKYTEKKQTESIL